LAFEKGHIELAETPVELQPEELRVSPSFGFLRIGGRSRIDIAYPCPEDIAYAEGERRRMVLQELVPDGRIHSAGRLIIAVGIPAHRTAPATTAAAIAGATAGRQYRFRGKVAGELEGDRLGDLEGIEELAIPAPRLTDGLHRELTGVDGIDLGRKDIDVAGQVPPAGERVPSDQFQTAQVAGFGVD